MLNIALELLEKGLHVFPLGTHGEIPPDHFIKERFNGDVEEAKKHWPKKPRVGWRSCQTSVPTEESVRKWWTRWPTVFGIAARQIDPSFCR
jgi:hypothetical protein